MVLLMQGEARNTSTRWKTDLTEVCPYINSEKHIIEDGQQTDIGHKMDGYLKWTNVCFYEFFLSRLIHRPLLILWA